MKRKLPGAVRLICFSFLLSAGTGCLKDKVTKTYQISSPVYATLAQARSAIKMSASSPVQFPGKIVLYRNYIFLNESGKGVHVIDNTNPAQPANIAFINIPGNSDIAIKNNILYADEAFGDLVALDIHDPSNVIVKKYVPQIFNNYNSTGIAVNPDSVMVIVDWVTKDTTVTVGSEPTVYYYPMAMCAACESFNAAPTASAGKTSTGTNGSTSTFAISNNELYALSFGARINVVDVTTAEDPTFVNLVNLSGFTETIFPFGDKLFLGGVSGMSIYDISDPVKPALYGSFSHVRTCDPVITDGEHAFVTLRSGTTCQGYTNELDILDISDLTNPTLITSYPLTNPRGLCKEGNLLFICDGTDGMKVYDATDIRQLALLNTSGGFEANDVIAQNGIAIVLAADGIRQFDYSDIKNIHQLSKIDSHATP